MDHAVQWFMLSLGHSLLTTAFAVARAVCLEIIYAQYSVVLCLETCSHALLTL